ncbi:class I glutamine amidotransferase-like protein [Ganoderma leucocontextum]|nr:class I glutamine amidotransferase-like protein [Ganoderma leucocontextum]
MKRILFVFTSANKNLAGGQTGYYLPEAAHPYYVLSGKYHLDFASPKGPNPTVDEYSVQAFPDDVPKFLENPAVQAKLAAAKRLADVKAADYDAIFYIGGHGPVIDLPQDPANIKLAGEFWRAGKLTTAVCHGPAALVNVTDAQGASIFRGRRATAFANEEEELMNAVKAVPFLVEDRIKELGGKYEKAAEPFDPKVVVDGMLITGQNPASAKGVAEAIDQALSA